MILFMGCDFNYSPFLPRRWFHQVILPRRWFHQVTVKTVRVGKNIIWDSIVPIEFLVTNAY